MTQLLQLGDFPLQSGDVLRTARLGYRVYGTLNAQRDNCVLLPTYYTGTNVSYAPIIGAGRVLDPGRYFIIVPDMFGNGISTSPSHCAGQRRAQFPCVTIGDNIRAQRRLLDHLGIERLALVGGWSMGAMQSLAWAALYPECVERLLPWCGSAICWPLNAVFLDGVRAALQTDSAYRAGGDAHPEQGLRAFGRVYAGWAYSAAFYRDARYQELGFASREAFLRSWEEDHVGWAADDLLAMLATWQSAAPAALVPGCDLAALLGRITAKTIVMPCDQDQYFTLAEAEIEAAHIAGAELRVLRSPYGHCAGAPGRFAEPTAAVETALADLLRR